MKISVLTATYNRKENLKNLYNSLLKNAKFGYEIEWIIMDDGSTDDTEEYINQIENNSEITIKYFKQDNQGKMVAINNIVQYAEGELLVECDSDDYLTDNAIKIICTSYEKIQNKKNIYAMVFLKDNANRCNIGTCFKDDLYETNMFNLYFKDGLEGDKALVYITSIRKKYHYRIEKNEKFSTEARMHNEMDKTYSVICFNKPIMICDYLSQGYSKNIKKVFMQNPNGYYEYFKQLLNFDMSGVLFRKRLYAIKHYILFCALTGKKNITKEIRGTLNKFLVLILKIPGYIKTKIDFKGE